MQSSGRIDKTVVVTGVPHAGAGAEERLLASPQDKIPTDWSADGRYLLYHTIDQQTGANSPLAYDDYLNNPTRNNFPIAFHKVDALRLSTTYEHEEGNSLISLTPGPPVFTTVVVLVRGLCAAPLGFGLLGAAWFIFRKHGVEPGM